MIYEEAELRRAVRALKEKYNVPLDCPEAEAFREKLVALMAVVITPTGERYRHEKRGSVYDVYGVGHANSAREVVIEYEQDFESRARGQRSDERATARRKVLFDREEVLIYRDVQTGAISVRGTAEFMDGRFTLLPPRAGREARPEPARAASDNVRPARVSPALGAPYGGSTSGWEGRRVEYDGPVRDKRGQLGTVLSWAEGRANVKWDDPSCDLAREQNVLNIKLRS